MKITIYGAGYVGLIAGACFAEVGNHVLCLDADEEKVRHLRVGEIPIYEPGLDELVQRNIQLGNIEFTTDPDLAIKHGLFQVIAVGTPQGEDGSADLQHVLAVARSIGKRLTDYKIIVNKSTVPVGAADSVNSTILECLKLRSSSVQYDVVSNPEFLKEGAAVNDFMRPDRIVIGTESRRAAELMSELYHPFNRQNDRLITMDVRSAELTKYAANAMLATKISFINEMANLAEAVGADIEKVRVGIGSDPRIGYSFIYPGCGYGGSCFPKDVLALNRTAIEHGLDFSLLNAVQETNARQKEVLAKKVMHYFSQDIKSKTFAVWGLAFKPGTDDMREASSIVLIETLCLAGASIQVFDPAANHQVRAFFGGEKVTCCDSKEACLAGADGLIVVTEWNAFRSPDFELIKKELRVPVIFDGRNMYEPALLRDFGIDYIAVGRSNLVADST